MFNPGAHSQMDLLQAMEFRLCAWISGAHAQGASSVCTAVLVT